MTKVSIAMTTFNGAGYLREQLESFVAQTRTPDQLVICDDGSQDETVELLHAFSTSANFVVKIVENDRNLGYAANFQKAISLCDGDIVFLSDQDDIWDPTKIETFLDIIGKNTLQPQLVFSDADLVDQQGAMLNKTMLGQLGITNGAIDYYELDHRNLVTGATCAISRGLIDLVGPQKFPPNVPHDQILALLAWKAGNITCIDQGLIRYRLHPNNQIGAIRNLGDLFKAASQFTTRNYTQDRAIRNKEIADFLSNFNEVKVKNFWRKAAYYRALSRATPCVFLRIGIRYHVTTHANFKSFFKVALLSTLYRLSNVFRHASY